MVAGTLALFTILLAGCGGGLRCVKAFRLKTNAKVESEMGTEYVIGKRMLFEALPDLPDEEGVGLFRRASERPDVEDPCLFYFNPNKTVLNGDQVGFDLELLSEVSQWWSTNTLTQDPQINYRFLTRLSTAINPRLCSWNNQENFDLNVHNGDSLGSIDKFPLLPQYNMPTVFCAFEDKIAKTYRIGDAVKSYPLYGPQGHYIADHTTSEWSPLCGQPDFFDAGTLLYFSGDIEVGSRVLTCEEARSPKRKMVNLFEMRCSYEDNL
eukprot:jgi/Bigna1/67670/fgenesh1_pg.4_\